MNSRYTCRHIPPEEIAGLSTHCRRQPSWPTKHHSWCLSPKSVDLGNFHAIPDVHTPSRTAIGPCHSTTVAPPQAAREKRWKKCPKKDSSCLQKRPKSHIFWHFNWLSLFLFYFLLCWFIICILAFVVLFQDHVHFSLLLVFIFGPCLLAFVVLFKT